MPSDAYVLGVTRLPSGACSASTSLIFRGPDQIAKLAAHAWKGQFWVELANAASLRDHRVPEPLLQSWSTDPSARTSRRPALFQLSRLAHGSPILRSVFTPNTPTPRVHAMGARHSELSRITLAHSVRPWAPSAENAKKRGERGMVPIPPPNGAVYPRTDTCIWSRISMCLGRIPHVHLWNNEPHNEV